MCASLLLSLPAPMSRACARSDSKSTSPPTEAALRLFLISPRCARGRGPRRILGATLPGAAGLVCHSPAPTPAESRHLPQHMKTEFLPTRALSLGDTALRVSGSRLQVLWESAAAPAFEFRVLCTCDARFSSPRSL